MECSKKYEFTRWNEWDHCISDSIQDFYQVFRIYPNVLLANTHTHTQIDFITTYDESKKNNAHHIVDENIDRYLDAIANSDEEVYLTGYSNDNCHLVFAIATEPELADKEFVLLFDDEPDGDDDEDNLPIEPYESKKRTLII